MVANPSYREKNASGGDIVMLGQYMYALGPSTAAPYAHAPSDPILLVRGDLGGGSNTVLASPHALMCMRRAFEHSSVLRWVGLPQRCRS